MAIEYKWIISNLVVKKINEMSDVVIMVDWRRIAKSGDHSVDVYGQVGLTAPNPANFKSFEQLTEADVISWVEQKIEPDVETLDANLANQIAEKENPPTQMKLPPWVRKVEL